MNAYCIALYDSDDLVDVGMAYFETGRLPSMADIANELRTLSETWCQGNLKGAWKIEYGILYVRRQSDAALFMMFRETILDLPRRND